MDYFTTNWAKAPPSPAGPWSQKHCEQPGCLQEDTDAGKATIQHTQGTFPPTCRAGHLTQCQGQGSGVGAVCRRTKESQHSPCGPTPDQGGYKKPKCYFLLSKDITETSSSSLPTQRHHPPTCALAKGHRATLSLLVWMWQVQAPWCCLAVIQDSTAGLRCLSAPYWKHCRSKFSCVISHWDRQWSEWPVVGLSVL